MGCVCTKSPDEDIDEGVDRFCLNNNEDEVLESEDIFKLRKSLVQKSGNNESPNKEILHHVMDTLGKKYSVIPNNVHDIGGIDGENGVNNGNKSMIELQNSKKQDLNGDGQNEDMVEQHVVDTEMKGENDLLLKEAKGESSIQQHQNNNKYHAEGNDDMNDTNV